MSSSWLVTQCRQFCDQCLQNTWGFACEAQAESPRFSGVAAKAAWRPSAIRECRQVVWRRCVSCICVRSEVHRASFSLFAAAPALVQSSSPGRCGVTLADCCCGSRDVAASHSHTVVAAAETLRRHIRRLLLRQQRRCGVTFAHCCCGSRDVAASTLSHCCCGSRDVAASHSQTTVAAAVRAIASYEYASREAGVIERRKRQLLRLLPRGALWSNVALKKPSETLLRFRSKSPQLWPGLIGL